MSLTCIATTQSTTYHFRNGKPFDWFIAVICDESGTLMIVSDHGDWSYRWGLAGLTTTLTREIGDRFSKDYMANKLCSESEEFDGEATRTACLQLVLRARRACELSKKEARDVWETLEDASWDDEGAVYEMLPSEIFDYPPDLIKTRPASHFLHLRDVYLPALKEALALPKGSPNE